MYFKTITTLITKLCHTQAYTRLNMRYFYTKKGGKWFFLYFMTELCNKGISHFDREDRAEKLSMMRLWSIESEGSWQGLSFFKPTISTQESVYDYGFYSTQNSGLWLIMKESEVLWSADISPFIITIIVSHDTMATWRWQVLLFQIML